MENIDSTAPLTNAGHAPKHQTTAFDAMGGVGTEHQGDLKGVIGTEATENLVLTNDGAMGLGEPIYLHELLAQVQALAETVAVLENHVAALRQEIAPKNVQGISLGNFTS